jgi:hypothetical protein
MSLHMLLRRIALLFAFGVFFPCAVQAVVQNVTVVTATGQPVPNATVTIVFPDGTTKEEETDDRGVLIFDFPNNGNYVIRYPGGQMSYTATGVGVAAAEPSMTPWVVAGVTLLGAGAAIASDDDSDSGSDSGGGTPGGGTGGGTVDGTYNCTFSQTANADSHPTGTLSGNYGVATSGSNVNITHQSGPTNLTASGSLSGSSANYTGSGTFQGFSGAQVSGTLTFGTNSATGNLNLVCSTCPDSNMNSTADPVSGSLSCTKS